MMVAYNSRSPRDDNRSLSPDAVVQLRSALGAYWAEAEGYDAELTAALTVVAQDARARGLRPEELLLALKAVEDDVAVSLEGPKMQDRDRFPICAVGACMRAIVAEDT